MEQSKLSNFFAPSVKKKKRNNEPGLYYFLFADYGGPTPPEQ